MIGSVLVCFAVKEEALVFGRLGSGRPGLQTLVTGMGRRNAERAVREFLAGGASVPASRGSVSPADQGRLAGSLAPPELVLTCGFTGGLNPELKLGDVVFEIPSRRSRGDETQIKTSDRLESSYVVSYETLIAAGAKPVKFFCADRIAVTAAEKAALWRTAGADAVEMESAAIHAVCREQGIPCATVRVVSDTADEDMPLDFNQLARPDLSLDYGKLAWAIAKSPGKIGALLKFQKQTQFAADRLAQVLVKLIAP